MMQSPSQNNINKMIFILISIFPHVLHDQLALYKLDVDDQEHMIETHAVRAIKDRRLSIKYNCC